MRQIPRRRLVSQLTRSTVAVVMAGGRGQRLMQLTDQRAKPATPFGGKYRIIDFSLSNCVNSGIRQIFILTQYKAHSLIQHVQRGWGYLHGELGEFIDIVPAQQQLGEIWYRGTADAVYQNLDIIHQHRPETVLILAGDHVYKMDYGPLIAFHKESGADITIGGVQVPVAQAHEFGVMTLGAEHRVVAFDEKPKQPRPMPGREGVALASMGIYVINPEFLREALERDAAIPDSQHDFGRNIVPEAVANRRVFAYPFEDVETKAQRYWRDVGTVDAYYNANMELIHVSPELNLYDEAWPIWTYQQQVPGAKFILDEDNRRGLAINSMIAGGCIISGAVVRESMLFFSVFVDEGTEVRRSVVLPEVEIGRSCYIANAIIDEGCSIPHGTIIGRDRDADREHFHVTEQGIVLVTRRMLAGLRRANSRTVMNLFAERRAGVLLHPTSLPGTGERGTFGAEARRFVDWLVAGGFSVWQTLPLGVTDAHGSPYALRSAYAGDPRFIEAADLSAVAELPAGIDAAGDRGARYASFAALATADQQRGFAQFMQAHRSWLEPYALFEHLSRRFDESPWWEWPALYRDRDSEALLECRVNGQKQLRALVFEQYLFELQWSALKRYANDRGVYLFGDLPFYVDRNNVDVWWQRELFAVDEGGYPLAVAGVPPDYFNAEGQLWGNPLYDWDAMQQSGFRWWLERIGNQLARFDLLRIDHFRALESYWAIPAGAATARLGEWLPGRGDALLTALRAELGEIPLVAEDLGIITDEVRALRDRFEIPGMAVLQFAFDGSPDNPYLPSRHRRNAVVYTGTHDNDTTVGWYASLDSRGREIVQNTLGVGPTPPVPDFLIDAAYASNAALAIVPMQDLLARDSGARMNTPGTVVGNWRWRFDWPDVPASLAGTCQERAGRYDRIVRCGQSIERYSSS